MQKLRKASIPIIAASFIAFFIVLLVTGSAPAYFPLALIPIMLAAVLLGIKGGIASSLIAMALVSLMTTREQGLPWPSHYIPNLMMGFLVYLLSGLLAGLWSTAERRRAKELARLADILQLSTELATLREESAVLNTLVSRIAALAASSACTVMLVDEVANEAVLAAQVGLPEGTPLGLRVPLTLPIIRRSLETGQPIIVPDIDRDAPEMRQVLVRKDIRAFFAYPLVREGRTLGYITLSSPTPRTPSAEEIAAYSLLAERAATAIETARLCAQVQHSLARITSLYELSSEVLATTTVEEAATLVAQKVVQVTGAQSALINLLSPDGKITLRISVGASGPLPPEPPPRPTGATMTVFRTGEPIVVAGLDEHSDLINPRLVEMGIKAFIGLPLKVEQRVTGVLFVRYTEPHLFSADEIQALTIYANHAAIALERARLLEETQRRLAELTTLFQVSRALREARTVEDMLPIILNSTAQVLQCDQGALSLVDREHGEVIVRVTTPGLESLLGMRTKIGAGVDGRVVQTGRPMLPSDSAGLQAPDAVRQVGESRTVVCYPLKVSEEVVGTIYLGTPREFSEGDLRLLEAIADMAASAIRRAGLFEELQARVRELTTVYEVDKIITATLRIEDVLDFVVGAACETLQAESAYLFLWDEREERLVMRAVQGLSSELVGQVKYRLGEGLSGWVFLEGKPANVPDLSADPRWKREPEYEAALPSGQALNALVVPLVMGTKTLGVLGVVNKIAAPAFSEGDQSLLISLAGQVAIAIENARLYEDVRGLSIATIRSLAAAIDARDPYTRGHSEHVARLSMLLARELGWSGADLEMLEFAALLHDVGKIAVPDAILRKTEPLTPEDWNSIRLHPYHSAQMIKPVEPLQRIIPWIYHHHERWDGTGYPDGLKGERIPLGARILAVADAFDAMTSDRPYRKALSREQAIAELRRCAGTQFDLQLVEVFVRLLEAGIDIAGGGRGPSGAAEPVVAGDR